MTPITKKLRTSLEADLRDLHFEIAETFEEAFNLNVEDHLEVLKGVVAENFFGSGYLDNPTSENCLSNDDPLAIYIHDGDVKLVQERTDSVPSFLNRLRPKSAYNESILFALANARMELTIAQVDLEEREIGRLLNSVRLASNELGIAKGVLNCREFGKTSARSGALTLAHKRNENRAHAMDVWRNEINPKLSAERAAEILRTKFNISIGHGNLARYISAEKRSLNAIDQNSIDKAPAA